MKIAIIGAKGVPAQFGGVERHVEELSSRLVDSGFDMTVYTRPWFVDKKMTEYKGIRLISMPSIKTKHLDAISHTFISSIHALFGGYDIIHYHAVGPALLAWIPKYFSKSKVIVTFHCQDRFHQKWGWFSRFALRLGEKAANKFADKTISVSQTIQSVCRNEYNNDVAYIPNGITNPPAPKPDLIKKEFGLDKNDYIVMVSRLVKHKGVHHLIRAFNKVKTDKKLVIVGGSAFTDDYVDSLHELAKSNSNILLVGFQKGDILHELFNNPYFFVHPSEAEGLPICVLEGMSYGNCVLISDIPENMEAVTDNGISFKNKDVDDLAKKMQYLFDNPDIVEKYGKKAKKHVLKHYNWVEIVQKTADLYKELNYINKKK